MPQHDELLRRIRKILGACLQLNMPEHELAGVTRLSDVVGLDSMAAVTLVAAIEREFQVVIEPEYLELKFLDNLPRLAEYLEARVKA